MPSARTLHLFWPVLLYAQLGWSQSGRPGAAKLHDAGASSFTIIPLGVKGGLDESNLSAYMVAPEGSHDYICLDAGTLYSGIRRAVNAGVFGSPMGHRPDPSFVLRHYIKAYFISHPHLDHVAGLILNSPDDSAKTIYGLPSCLDVLKGNYFTWEAWANFGDAGEKPFLSKYHYSVLSPGQEEAVGNTAFHITAFPLSHGAPYQSTAFLVRHEEAYLLYLGDTGADTVEHSDKLHLLWQEIAPLLKTGQLKAIMIEVSFPDEQPLRQLFGHLTPFLLMKEMSALSTLTGKQALSGLPVLITHLKPSGDQETRIRKQLTASNPLNLKLIFPEQAVRIDL
ncbi:MAG TPA: 3',5'-cyclic-nucleotide phosphodiesterase [Puia sp.]|nr:3',5'-cyclic-nucleotide phosphodiesterase [Puia sp.]